MQYARAAQDADRLRHTVLLQGLGPNAFRPRPVRGGGRSHSHANYQLGESIRVKPQAGYRRWPDPEHCQPLREVPLIELVRDACGWDAGP
jgi:hypothetical protein